MPSDLGAKTMATEISVRVEQSVQVTSYCHQRVAIGLSGIPDDASDEQIQALLNGPVHRTFKRLSKAVLDKCDDMRIREIKRMKEETKETNNVN